MSTGYAWWRFIFRPWHYIKHVKKKIINNWQSKLFCTYCVDARIREFYK